MRPKEFEDAMANGIKVFDTELQVIIVKLIGTDIVGNYDGITDTGEIVYGNARNLIYARDAQKRDERETGFRSRIRRETKKSDRVQSDRAKNNEQISLAILQHTKSAEEIAQMMKDGYDYNLVAMAVGSNNDLLIRAKRIAERQEKQQKKDRHDDYRLH